jgi:hypothetical protein
VLVVDKLKKGDPESGYTRIGIDTEASQINTKGGVRCMTDRGSAPEPSRARRSRWR